MPKFNIKPPPDEQENPYIPPGPPEPLTFETFAGINTSTTRPGVDEKQMWWCDGFMPLGPQFLRTLYGVGPQLYTTSGVTQIVFFDFINIDATPYCIVILADGEIQAINTSTRAVLILAGAGTITSPSRDSVGIASWGSDFAIIVADQTNGYFVWDGTVLARAGTLSPSVVVTNGGSGYTSAPGVSASGGSGSGATFAVTISGGVVTEIAVTNPGTGYVVGDVVTLSFSGGGGSGAAATASLMPFGVSGTAVEVYSGRVWIASGASITFSAPGSFSDFSTGSGGGSFTSTDSFLRVRFVALKQTNGFLYLLADSSINYISGVQTTGSPPTTTFTNQNADPEVGTPWATTVDVFGRNIIFANAFGAHVSYGAAVTKVSEELDGIYNTVPNFGGITPSAAKAIVFGKKVWILLLPVIDPISGQQVNKLFMWNGKVWWASGQDVDLTYVQHQEIDSVLTAYGTDGEIIYPLFQQPSVSFNKVVQSKLWAKPGYLLGKAATRLWGMVQYYSILAPDLTISIDNETTSATSSLALGPQVVEWTTALGLPMEWTTATGDPMVWRASGTGILVIEPTAISQQGALLGMTATTNSADMAIISLAIDAKIVQYRG
jgi:hypothetical protein